MTLNDWIEDYCSDNNITLPDDIPDNQTALNVLILIKESEQNDA